MSKIISFFKKYIFLLHLLILILSVISLFVTFGGLKYNNRVDRKYSFIDWFLFLHKYGTSSAPIYHKTFIFVSIVFPVWLILIFTGMKIEIIRKIILPAIPTINFIILISFFLMHLKENPMYSPIFFIGFYLYLLYALVGLSFYIYPIVKNKMIIPYRQCHKKRKTKAERIAELEKQVAELQSKSDKDA